MSLKKWYTSPVRNSRFFCFPSLFILLTGVTGSSRNWEGREGKGAEMVPLINASVQPYNPAEYIQTAMTGNRVSRKATVLGSQNIILGGKCIIHSGAIIRGDLRRLPTKSADAGSKEGGQSANTVVISMGRYCTLGEGCLLRPAYKTYRG